jgi:DNA primase
MEIKQISFMNIDEAPDYLSGRGIGTPEAAKWHLGFFGDSTRRMVSVEFGPLAAQSVGLSPVYYDRILFPLTDLAGAVVGFVGRTLTGEAPKWVYPTDNYLFARRSHLIGLFEYLQLRREKIDVPPPVVVEGPFDVIQMWKHGIPAIGSHGTGLTKEQCLLLRNVSPRELFVCPDPEEEARDTYKRTIERSRGSLPDVVREVMLPPGLDPDQYLRDHGPTRYKELMRNSTPYV